MVGNFLLKANKKISHRIKIVFPRKKAMAPLGAYLSGRFPHCAAVWKLRILCEIDLDNFDFKPLF